MTAERALNSRAKNGKFQSQPFSKLGSLITERRYELNVTQSGLARAAGIDSTYLSRLERGEREPSQAVVDKIVGALELSYRRELAFYWAAGFIPPKFREQIIADQIFEAFLALGESGDPKRTIALMKLGAAASELLDTMR